MVVASKWRLQVAISAKHGEYDKDGQKKQLKSRIVIPRAKAMQDNEAKNNILWIIDEEATKEFYAQREKNINRKAEEARRANVGNADLVDAIVAMASGKLPATSATTSNAISDTSKDDEIAALKAQLDHANTQNSMLVEELNKVAEPLIEKKTEPEDAPQQQSSEFEAMTLDQLRAACDEKGIKYHHLAKEGKLVELLTENA